MSSDVERLLRSFVAPFLAGEDDRIANAFEEPLVLIRQYDNQVLTDRGAFNAESSRLRHMVRARGATDLAVDVLDERRLGPALLSVDACWRHTGRGGRVVAAVHITYILRRAETGLTVAAQISHNSPFERAAGPAADA